jgi:uncharacterized protein with NAD-binding domain and iron-sulfur cluster
VVLGGGVGAVTAAFELTRPELDGRYDVTLYQLGWRLGGKGASGRRGPTQRIEEHGLHIWFGFYDNAFRAMRDCYAELDRGPACPVRTIDDAFHPASRFGVAERRLDRWTTWLNWFPDAEGEPGTDFADGREERTVAHYLVQLLQLGASAARGLLSLDSTHLRVTVPPRPPSTGPIHATAAAPHHSPSSLMAAAGRRVDQVGDLVDWIEMAGLITALELAATLSTGVDWLGPKGSAVVRLLDGFVDDLEDRITDVVDQEEVGARVLELLDLVATIVRGLIHDGVVTHPDGLDALDHFDLLDWLRLHGARRVTIEGGLVRGIYDLVFAYRGGRADRPAFAAGQALRGSFRMFFDYRGSFAYRMQAGMGDIVFAPYYEVLRRRGVRFEFFHRVTGLMPSTDGTRIDRVRLERQIEVLGERYDPLVDVDGLPCWPAEPNWDQLGPIPEVDGRRPDFESSWNQPPPVGPPIELFADQDFDHVVLGLSLGSLPDVCSELVEQRRDWRDMVEQVGTVQTQALQIWLKRSTVELGGDPTVPIVAGYVEPFDTWADMTHLVEHEHWDDATEQPQSIHYFCSAMPGPVQAPAAGSDGFPTEQLAIVADDAQRFLDLHIGHFLPDAVHVYPREFRHELLVDPPPEPDGTPVPPVYVRANVSPSERYVQSLPGTSKYRLRPSGSGYSNLVLAGDWTDCGFNAGCVEAATISGLLAARAVMDIDTDDIVGLGDA